MSAARYSVVKYIPDLLRMEPRNVGVVVWSSAGVDARFFAEKGELGQIDKRKARSRLDRPRIYEQWVQYWRSELTKPEISPTSGGREVSRSDPEYLDVLMTSSRGNYVLVEGGEAFDPIGASELAHFTDHLFSILVTDTSEETGPQMSLGQICQRLIREASLPADPRFSTRYPLICPIGDTTEDFEFSYAYGDGEPQRLYHRLPLPWRQKTSLWKTVHDSAWMFDKVTNAGIIDYEEGAVITYVTDNAMNSEPEIVRALEVLGSVTRVFNLNDPEQEEAAASDFSSLSSLPVH